MNFYFYAYITLGLIYGVTGWWVRVKNSGNYMSLPQWMITTPYLHFIMAFSSISILLALITTFINYGLKYLFYSILEFLLGVFFSGFLRTNTFIILVILAVPINITVIGAFWGLWYI